MNSAAPKEHSPTVLPLLVDAKTASQMLGLSCRYIQDLTKSGALASRLIGKRRLYSIKALRRFAEGRGV